MDMRSFFDHDDTSNSSTEKNSTSSTTASTSYPNPEKNNDQEEDECWSCPCTGCKDIKCGTRDRGGYPKVEQCHNHGGWGFYMCKTCKLCSGSNGCCTCAGNPIQSTSKDTTANSSSSSSSSSSKGTVTLGVTNHKDVKTFVERTVTETTSSGSKTSTNNKPITKLVHVWEYNNGRRMYPKWKKYNSQTQARFNEAFEKGEYIVNYAFKQSTYTCDLKEKTQTNDRTGWIRTIRCLVVPWPSSKSAATQSNFNQKLGMSPSKKRKSTAESSTSNKKSKSASHFYFYGGRFSQFWKSTFYSSKYQETYTSAEQYMMVSKARTFNDTQAMHQMLTATNPKDIKKMGRNVGNKQAVSNGATPWNEQIWDRVKFDIVVDGNFLKFNQNEKLKKHLKATNNDILVEASPYDKIWGIGLSVKNAQNGKPWPIDKKTGKVGQNLLGKALMQVRDLL